MHRYWVRGVLQEIKNLIRWSGNICGKGERGFVKYDVAGDNGAVSVTIKANIPLVMRGIAKEDT
jgi:hypothetical protein